MISSIKSRATYITTLLFITHGVLYFFWPESIYDNSSKIKIVKYILFSILFIVNIKSINIKRLSLYIVMILLMLIATKYGNSSSTLIQFANYVFPLSIIVFDNILDDIRKYNLVLFTLIMTWIMGYLDFYFLKIFKKWWIAGVEYREVSIFVNPNILGIVIAFFTFYLLYYYNENWIKKYKFGKLVIILNSIILSILSGSKTGIFLIFISIFLNYSIKITRSSIKILASLLITIPIIYLAIGKKIIEKLVEIFFVGQNLRDFSLSSLKIRGDITQDFFDLVKTNFVFPFKDVSIGIDNTYLHIWGTFGILFFIIFIILNIIIMVKGIWQKQWFICISIVLFLVGGITTNFMYVWPLSYIYWYLVMNILTFNKRGLKVECIT